MILPFSISRNWISIDLQSPLDKSVVSLEAIRNARGDINEIRIILKGSVENCHSLFKKAVEEGDVVTQIQLSYALFGMKWGKDSTRDFSSLTVSDLEIFSYSLRGFLFFNSAYDEAMGITSDQRTREARGIKTFGLAASRGDLSAFLELMYQEWKPYTDSYGFAVQLRPFVGKGDKTLDNYFGQALKRGCQIGSKLYYEGLYWMNQSGGISVEYPKENQSFKHFKHEYIKNKNFLSSYYEHDDFLHVGTSIILAPSREAWETFVKEKLENVKIASMKSYLFTYNQEQIKFLLNEYKISTAFINSFVESSEGKRIEESFGNEVRGFRIDSLVIYQNHKKIGQISVQEDTFKIHQTFKNLKIQPIIDFIENVMTRTGSAYSANGWLQHINHRDIISRL